MDSSTNDDKNCRVITKIPDEKDQDDLFDVFGSDSSNDSDSDNDDEGAAKLTGCGPTTKISLHEEELKQKSRDGGAPYIKNMLNNLDLSLRRKKETLNENHAPALWSNDPPIFFSSLVGTDLNLSSDIGGQRGYVAKCDIPAGMLLLKEETLIPWSRTYEDDEEEKEVVNDAEGSKLNKNFHSKNIFVKTLRKMLLPNASLQEKSLLEKMNERYPENMDKDMTKDFLYESQSIYKTDIERIMDELKSRTNNNTQTDEILSHEWLLQKLLAMQCNGFESGLSLHCVLINHSCQPNCIKISNPITASEATEESSTTLTPPSRQDNKTEKLSIDRKQKPTTAISHIYATRDISKGEPLCISYIQPPYQLKITRQKLLQKQFGFSCQCVLCSSKTIHKSDNDNVSVETIKQEEYSNEMEQSRLLDIERMLGDISSANSNDTSMQTLDLVLNTALDVMSETLEEKRFPPSHMVFLRLHSIVSNAAGMLLMSSSASQNERSLLGNTSTTATQTAVIFLRSSYEKLLLQLKFISTKHLDLASTCLDISEGLRLLLSQNPSIVTDQEFVDVWPTFREASQAENQFHKCYEKLRALYDE